MFSDTRVEWRINDIERSLAGKAESHEVSALRSDVGRLECSLRDASADIARLRTELDASKEEAGRLRDVLSDLIDEVATIVATKKEG